MPTESSCGTGWHTDFADYVPFDGRLQTILPNCTRLDCGGLMWGLPLRTGSHCLEGENRMFALECSWMRATPQFANLATVSDYDAIGDSRGMSWLISHQNDEFAICVWTNSTSQQESTAYLVWLVQFKAWHWTKSRVLKIILSLFLKLKTTGRKLVLVLANRLIA